MRKLSISALFCGIVLVCAVWPAHAVTLVKDGKPASMIIVNNNPVPSQKMAAQDLQYHLQKMTGALVPIVAERDMGITDDALIFVGQSDALKAKGIDTTTLPNETFIVKTIGNALVLAGEDGATGDPYKSEYDNMSVRSGTFYAVADFLQDQLGVRWLWPGPTGEVIPKRATVTVDKLNIQETPQLFQRHYRLGGMGAGRAPRAGRPGRGGARTSPFMEGKQELFAEMSADLRLWMKRMKMGNGTRFGYGHSFTQWFDRYIDTVPEVFAMQKDGHRGIPSPTYNKSFVKICCSSDKLIDMLIQQFMEERAKNPNHRYLNAVEDDGNGGFCQCDACRALDVKMEPATKEQLEDIGWSGADIAQVYGEQNDGLPYSLSNRYFTFYNKLARRLHEVAPDAYVVAYAYDRYKFAPINLKIEPNIIVGLIGFNMYPASASEQKLQRDNLLAWKKAGVQKLFFRPNSFSFSPSIGIPWNDVSQMAGDLRLLLDNGIVATDWDSLNGYWATAGQTYYVLTRQHWDTKADPEDLRQEYNLAFGPAAPYVKAYWDHWEKTMLAAYGRPDLNDIIKPFGGGRTGRWNAVHVLLKQEDFDTGRVYLNQARAAAEKSGDPDLLKRIEVLELGLRNGELEVRACAFARAENPDADTDYREHGKAVKEMYEIRDKLLELRSYNVSGLNNADGTRYDTRVALDFYKRPYLPVMAPTLNKWVFAPDVDNKGEAELWFNGIPEAAVPHDAKGVGIGQTSPNGRIGEREMAMIGEMAARAQTPGNLVTGAWYQVQVSPGNIPLPGDAVIYLPAMRGAVKIWINDKLVVERADGRDTTGEPLIATLSSAGVKPGDSFRVTIRVSESGGAGGFTRPFYIAAPSVN